MTKLLEKLNSYLGKIFYNDGNKRPISNDDDDDEDEDGLNMNSPPFKKSKIGNYDFMNILDSGSINSNRISDRNLYSFRENSSSTYYSREMSNSKAVEKIIPIRIESSISSDKENSPSIKPQFPKGIGEEWTPITSKYFSGLKKCDPQQEEIRSLLYPSFRFKPSATSTAHKPDSYEVFSATKRKPLRTSESSPSKWMVFPPLSTRFGIKKRYSDFSRVNKKRTLINPASFPSLKRMFLTPRESIRLEERERYSQLLQQHTNSTITQSRLLGRDMFTSLLSKGIFDTDVAEKSGAVVKVHLDPKTSLRAKRQLEKRETSPVKSPSSVIPKEISITRDSSNVKSVPIIDLEPHREINKEVKLDDDLFIVKEIKPPGSRQNSLENELQKSQFYSHEWLKDLVQFYKEKKKSVDDDVEFMYETKKKCQETRQKQEKVILKKVEDRISQLDITYPRPFVEITEEEEEKFPELTSEMENIIERAFRGGPPGQVLAEKFNIQITRRDIQTLAGLNWLNDEVINFYTNMLMERGKNDNYPSVYAFNTFFYSKLVKTGYASVKRWTKKVDIFSHDLLIIPVHLGMHWCLATIDFRKKTINYYDSMHGNNNTCLMELRKYLESEHQDKKRSSYDVSAFSTENVKDIPQQMNGSDCGMFSCKFAEYLSRDAPITFDQEHMPYFRRRMVYEIVTQKLL